MALLPPFCFNPTKVLLKPISNRGGISIKMRFNPTKVLLKPGVRPGPQVGSVLQPYKGPAETSGRGDDRSNSVALQPYKGPAETGYCSMSAETSIPLQPYKGPAETPRFRLYALMVPRFNPTEVLLKLLVVLPDLDLAPASTLQRSC